MMEFEKNAIKFNGDLKQEIKFSFKILWGECSIWLHSPPFGYLYFTINNGYVKSWTIGLSPNADLVNTMLKDTIAKLHENEKPIIHSDYAEKNTIPKFWIRQMKIA